MSSPVPLPINPSLQDLPSPQSRFQIDLEFLQSLSSPSYLHYLATTPPYHLTDVKFRRYLLYLKETWEQVGFVEYVEYVGGFWVIGLILEEEEEVQGEEDDEDEEGGGISKYKKAKTKTKAVTNAFIRNLANRDYRDYIHKQIYNTWKNRSGIIYGK